MKINFASKTLIDNDKLLPVDPPPPIDLNKLFELKLFRVSKTSFNPFEEIQIQWEIETREPGTSFNDYHFLLRSTDKDIVNDLKASGTVPFTPHKNTLLRIMGQKRGRGGNMVPLGSGVALNVDESDAFVIEIPATVVDFLVEQKLTTTTSANANIRLKGAIVSNWTVFQIGYNIPLELVINNFFNGDISLKLNISFHVNHDATDSILDVTITHSSDVNFHWLEDVLSLGHTKSVEATTEKLWPLIIDCKVKDMELSLLKKISSLIGARSATHRLLDVRLIVDGNFTRINIVLVPFPQEKPLAPITVPPSLST